ncbi:hypothetical protein ACI780_21320 [Geodermatophilus sp. SYSU D00814]
MEPRAEGAEERGDGEEDGDGLGPDLEREDLADGEVGRARPAEAKKMIDQAMVWVIALSTPAWNSTAVIARSTPDRT